MKIRLIVIKLLFFILIFLTAAPVFAYSGVTGTIVDSKTFTPWTHGGEVYVLDTTTGNLISTCSISSTAGTMGEFSCTYGSDDLGVGGVDTTGIATGDDILVIFDYSCPTNSSNCTGTYSPPSQEEFVERPYTELAFLSGVKDLGDFVQTGTGPTAVSLQSLSAEGAQAVIPPAIALVGLVLAIGTVVVLRRRKQSTY